MYICILLFFPSRSSWTHSNMVLTLTNEKAGFSAFYQSLALKLETGFIHSCPQGFTYIEIAFYWLIIIAAFLYISELKCVFRNLIVKTSALEFYGSKLTTIISWKYFRTACTFIVTWISFHQARPKLNSPMNTKHVLGGSWVHECVCKSNHNLIEKNWWRHTGYKCLLSTPTTNLNGQRCVQEFAHFKFNLPSIYFVS